MIHHPSVYKPVGFALGIRRKPISLLSGHTLFVVSVEIQQNCRNFNRGTE